MNTRNHRGQFLPISAMVMLATVVFLVAVVNIYKTTKAKLVAQNLAEAIALNLAAQQAQSLNTIADRNEWLNHMYEDSVSPSMASAQKGGPVSDPYANIPEDILPPLSCASEFVFNSQPGVENYAELVKTVNDTQRLFADRYNEFLGVGQKAGGKNLKEVLMRDIEELRNDSSLSVYIWDHHSNELNDQKLKDKIKQLADKDPDPNASDGAEIEAPGMKGIQYRAMDVPVKFKQRFGPDQNSSLGALYAKKHKVNGPPQPIGPLGLPDANNSGSWNAMSNISKKSNKPAIGVGATVFKRVDSSLFGHNAVVQARAVAHVVMESGAVSGAERKNPRRPIFKPTFWVKLGEPQ